MAPRILVAEDTSAHAKVLRFCLVGAGYDVTVAVDGRQAWMAAQREQFDLVITDYKMPNMSGIDLCRLLRQDRLYVRTPIILVSAFCQELRLDLIQTRFFLSAICEKPIVAAELLKVVEDNLTACAVAG